MSDESISISRGNYLPGVIYTDADGKKFVIARILN